MKKIILASTSPQRKKLLEQLCINFEIQGTDWEDKLPKDQLPVDPREHVLFLSQGKAREVAKSIKEGVIIAADTVVSYGNHILGKPHTYERAVEMLQMLSGQTQKVFTGYTILDIESGQKLSKAVETKIKFKPLSQEEIENYIKKDNPLENGGSYKIQSLGVVLVESIEGDYYNVVGLPLSDLAESLKEFGVSIL